MFSMRAPERIRSRYQSAVRGIAEQHRAGEPAVANDELLVEADAGIGQHDLLGALAAEKVAGREHVDAGDLQVGGQDAAG